MSGTKKRPLRAEASRFAATGMRHVCVSMLLVMMKLLSGNVLICQRKATMPTAITAVSLRKMPMR